SRDTTDGWELDPLVCNRALPAWLLSSQARAGSYPAAAPSRLPLQSGEVQIGVQVCMMQQLPDDWLCARDDELMPAPRQAFMCPDQDRKTSAIREVKPGQVHHEDRRVALQGTADGVAQTVSVGHVKLALQPQH